MVVFCARTACNLVGDCQRFDEPSAFNFYPEDESLVLEIIYEIIQCHNSEGHNIIFITGKVVLN
jgi:hypothetical protein